jgi:hypothetical protein
MEWALELRYPPQRIGERLASSVGIRVPWCALRGCVEGVGGVDVEVAKEGLSQTGVVLAATSGGLGGGSLQRSL